MDAKFFPCQLPDDVESVGYRQSKQNRFEVEHVFKSKIHNFTGTEQEFVDAGFAYRYRQIDRFSRVVVQGVKS